MRQSSTKGKQIQLASPALPKGSACHQCKQRKVRCDGVGPICGSCRRTAKFEHRPAESACCTWVPSKRSGPRRRKSSADEVQAPSVSVAKQLPEVPSLPIQAPTTEVEHPHPSTSTAWTMMSDLLRRESNSSSSSAEPPSLSSSRCSTRQGSPSSPKPYTAYSMPLPPLPYTGAAPCLSPLPMDSSAYFDALNFAASSSTSQPPQPAPEMLYGNLNPYPLSLGLPSLFPLALPALPSLAPNTPKPAPLPSFFDLPPHPSTVQQEQNWSDQMLGGLDLGWSMQGVGGPITPGALDWDQFGAGAMAPRPVF